MLIFHAKKNTNSTSAVWGGFGLKMLKHGRICVLVFRKNSEYISTFCVFSLIFEATESWGFMFGSHQL